MGRGGHALDLGGTEVPRVDLDDDLAARDVDALFFLTGAAPSVGLLVGERGRWGRKGALDGHAEDGERLLDELAHGVRLARREHEVLGRGLLEHEPHALDVVARCAAGE